MRTFWIVVLIALGLAACTQDADSSTTDTSAESTSDALQSTPHLKYMGWYASGSDIEDIADHSNVAWTWANPAADAETLAAEAVDALQRARAQGMTVVLAMGPLFFDGWELRSPEQYQQNWATYEAAIRPYESSIAAFYPMDEPGNICAGVSPDAVCNWLRSQLQSSLEASAYTMKQSFPNTPIAVIHTFWEMRDDIQGKRPLMNPWFFDWLGFDCYGDYNNCMGYPISSAGLLTKSYMKKLKQRLRPGQRTILVPDAWAHDGVTQAQLVTRAHQYYNLAKTDPSVIGLFSFIWRHGEMQGASTMPDVAEIWRGVGREVTMPEIWGSGPGCDDGYCIWITGRNFTEISSIDIRLPGSGDIIAQYGGADVARDLSNQWLAFRVREDQWDAFNNGGLMVWVVNAQRGNWSEGVLVTRPN